MKPRKINEARKKTPNSRSPNISSKGKPQGKEEAKVAGQPKGQRDETPQDQGREAAIIGEKAGSDTAVLGTCLWQYSFLSPLLQQRPEDIERRKAQAQDPKFLRALERCLERKRKDLDILDEELSNNSYNELLRDHIIHAQNEEGSSRRTSRGSGTEPTI